MAFTLAKRYSEYALLGVLGLAPIFALTVRGWTTLTLVLAAILSLALLMLGRKSNNNLKHNQQEPNVKSNANFWVGLMIITFASPLLAVLISQSLRHDWVWKAYDAPVRFLVAIPLFLCVYKRNIQVMKVWQWSFPLMVFSTLIILPYLPSGGWSGSLERVTTSFVDPLTFGHITLTFGLLCLFIFNNNETESLQWKILKLFGVAAGIYLSIKSGSRTGWIALPIILLIWGLTRPWLKHPIAAITIALCLGLGTSLTAYNFSTIIHSRVNESIQEIQAYHWDQQNSFTSVGARLSFARMGAYYFSLRPWTGWGDQGYKDLTHDPEITKFADPIAQNFPLTAGFHNEFTTNGVHYGIWGIISTSLLFFIPLAIFLKAYCRRFNVQLALIGITYIICELASSMTTEVWNLKFTAAFSAMLIAGICGEVLSELNFNKKDGVNNN
jgi:O-antigen ligase